MNKILMIEDDRFVPGVYRDRFCSHGYAVDLALDGKAGLERLQAETPDLVLLDLMLPELSGLEVLKTIRSQRTTHDLPVVVFSNAYLGNMLEQAWEAGATHVLPKATHTPGQVIEVIRSALSGSRPPDAQKSQEHSADLDREVRDLLLDSTPRTLGALRQHLQTLAEKPGNLRSLQEMCRELRPLTAAAAIAGFLPIAQLIAAFDALVQKLRARPEHVTPSTLRTIAQTIDAIALLLEHHNETPDPYLARVLIVDDDEFACRAASNALEKADLKPTTALSAEFAKRLLATNQFDMIFLDLQVPEVNGLEFCSSLRKFPEHQTTPIVFLTLNSTFVARAESVLRGGNDFITKPFLFPELAVKALIHIMTRPWTKISPHSQTGPAIG